jgi:hypothetical protein
LKLNLVNVANVSKACRDIQTKFQTTCGCPSNPLSSSSCALPELQYMFLPYWSALFANLLAAMFVV